MHAALMLLNVIATPQWFRRVRNDRSIVGIRTALMLVSLLGGNLWQREARANGAFPDSLQLLLPSDQYNRIVLATNFGLISSNDGGETWGWSCEQSAIAGATLYASGPPPDDRLFTLTAGGELAWSADRGCSWTTAAGNLTGMIVSDYFADPSDASHILAAAAPAAGTAPPQVFASHDSGATFSEVLFTADGLDDEISGVEIAQVNPSVVYLAVQSSGANGSPRLVQSIDAGESWTTHDLTSAIGMTSFRILTVDASNADLVFLRVMGPSGDSVAVTSDAGATITTPVAMPGGKVSAFARLASGTVLIGALLGSEALGFRSSDGGATFQSWSPVPHLEALAERNGVLFAAAQNYVDFAVGKSMDEGVTFEPIAMYDEVSTVDACARLACGGICSYEASMSVWPATVCSAPDGAVEEQADTDQNGCNCQAGYETGCPTVPAILSGLIVWSARIRRRHRNPVGKHNVFAAK